MIGKHWFYFNNEMIGKSLKNGEKIDVTTWDDLRRDNQDKAFSIESSMQEYRNNCNKAEDYKQAADVIGNIIACSTITKVVSCGVGKAILEYHLKQISPDLYLHCTDYTYEAIKQLEKVFIECDAFSCFDMKKDDWGKLSDYEAVILYRLSTEFSRQEWKDIFLKMKEAGFGRIIFVPTELCKVKDMMFEALNHWKNVIAKKHDVFCGYLYTEDEWIKMWGKMNIEIITKVEINNTAIYYLKLS